MYRALERPARRRHRVKSRKHRQNIPPRRPSPDGTVYESFDDPDPPSPHTNTKEQRKKNRPNPNSARSCETYHTCRSTSAPRRTSPCAGPRIVGVSKLGNKIGQRSNYNGMHNYKYEYKLFLPVQVRRGSNHYGHPNPDQKRKVEVPDDRIPAQA
jgi:hypothetical protein